MISNITIIGAGIIGLTCALDLSQAGFHVTVYSIHIPGDFAPQYASSMAGANWMSMAGSEEAIRLDLITLRKFQHLADTTIEAGIERKLCRIFYNRQQPPSELLFRGSRPWYASTSPSFKTLDKTEVPSPYEYGFEFESVVVNTKLYLTWLHGQCIKHGVKFIRRKINDLKQIRLTDTDCIVNACGNSYKDDSASYITRGQTILVQNSIEKMYFAAGDGDEITYIMTRPHGGGTILGGSYQPHNSCENADNVLSEKIISRCRQICPELCEADIEIISTNVGFRHTREGGPRIERCERVIHAYGFGGYGYQSSYGVSEKVQDLIEDMSPNKVARCTL